MFCRLVGVASLAWKGGDAGVRSSSSGGGGGSGVRQRRAGHMLLLLLASTGLAGTKFDGYLIGKAHNQL